MRTRQRPLCMEHSGVTEKITAIDARGANTERKLDRLLWWMIATFGVTFLTLIFSATRDANAGH